MQQTSRRAAATPLRALVIVLLLAGFGLWQAWQCSQGMAASPIAGMPSMGMITVDAGHAGMQARPEAQSTTGHDMPSGMAGLCITVLAGIAAALLLIAAEPRLLALIRRTVAALVPLVASPSAGPSLARLCVSRT